MSANDFRAVVAQVRATGKTAYYLGPRAGDLPLNGLDLFEESAPAFQVEADYGTCNEVGDGGCGAPIVVSTTDRRPDVGATTCERLDPQLGVPAGVVDGVVTLATGDLLISVSDIPDQKAGDDVRPALGLLRQLTPVGATEPVRTLPPPSPAAAAWLDEVCGTVPGQGVTHEIETPDPLGNSRVPDFIVERLGGGELTWSSYRGTPVVVVVGTVAQVSSTLRRWQPALAKTRSHAVLLGLVWDPTGDKLNPRPVADLEQEAGALPAPVGYEAVPLSAVWFLDAASNTGLTSAEDSGVVAFVDTTGLVERFASLSTPDPQVSEWARALG